MLAERARPAFARRLEARLKELLGEAQLDPARLAQEAAMAAERSDVSEELARLASHVQQFESLLAGASDVGKKLDFLLQEMQRESEHAAFEDARQRSRGPGNHAARRSKSNPKSKNCANRCRTSNEPSASRWS